MDIKEKYKKEDYLSNVKKIKCDKLPDSSYKCDITSGAYMTEFNRCVAQQLKGIPRNLAGIKHAFLAATHSCRGLKGIISQPTTDTYFLKSLNIQPEANTGVQLRRDSPSFTLKGKHLNCFFDEQTDSMDCFPIHPSQRAFLQEEPRPSLSDDDLEW